MVAEIVDKELSGVLTLADLPPLVGALLHPYLLRIGELSGTYLLEITLLDPSKPDSFEIRYKRVENGRYIKVEDGTNFGK